MDKFDDIGEFIKKHYFILIIVVVIIFIILGIIISKSFWSLLPESGRERVERISSLKYDTIMELFEYYECEYITTVAATKKGYALMYNVKLRLPPSEGNILNETFYMSLLNDVALYLSLIHI